MKYLIGSIALIPAVVLTLSVLYCLYMAWISGLAWLFVAVGVAMPATLCILIVVAAFSAAKEY